MNVTESQTHNCIWIIETNIVKANILNSFPIDAVV